jgi:hypothetical protein
MDYTEALYNVATFVADADLAAGLDAVARIAALTDVQLTMSGLRSVKSEAVNAFRKRRYSQNALDQFAAFSAHDSSQSVFVFDPRWSKTVAPSIIINWAQNTSRENQGFLLAAFAEQETPLTFASTAREVFAEIGGTSGGLARCPYVLPDGTSLEWAYRNNLNRAGEPRWRFTFTEKRVASN